MQAGSCIRLCGLSQGVDAVGDGTSQHMDLMVRTNPRGKSRTQFLRVGTQQNAQGDPPCTLNSTEWINGEGRGVGRGVERCFVVHGNC